MLKVSHPAELPLVADFRRRRCCTPFQRPIPRSPVQRIVPTLTGRPSLIAQPPGGDARVVRLFGYLPGVPLPKAQRSQAQARQLARTLASSTWRCAARHPRWRGLSCRGISSAPTVCWSLLDCVPDRAAPRAGDTRAGSFRHQRTASAAAPCAPRPDPQRLQYL
ncbi:hypothetical protein ACU4GD_20955 [Cupriavidus basilensis]